MGYFPADPKSLSISSKADEAATRAAHEAEGLTLNYTRGHRYVCGFVGLEAMEDGWIIPQVVTWLKGIESLTCVAACHPSTVYAEVVWSLQSE